MNVKERSAEIYKQHIALASENGKLFRKTVMQQMIAEFGCSLPSAGGYYNFCKKAMPVEGLGRAPVNKNVRRMPGGKQEILQDDNDCYSVLELVKSENKLLIGRCRSFLMQGDASEEFDSRTETYPDSKWVMIKGLGPICDEQYKLEEGEEEIKRFDPNLLTA